MIVYIIAAGLKDEDVFVTDRFGDFDVCLSVRELANGNGNQWDVKPVRGFVINVASLGSHECRLMERVISPLSHCLGELGVAVPCNKR